MAHVVERSVAVVQRKNTAVRKSIIFIIIAWHLGVQHTAVFFVGQQSSCQSRFFGSKKLKKIKCPKEAKEEKESTTQLTLLILIYPRINK